MGSTISSKGALTLLIGLLLMASVRIPSCRAYVYGTTGRRLGTTQESTREPWFEETPTQIAALVGQTVTLPCSVAELGDKVVSWIRTSDLHILTSNVFTFTSDERFSVMHEPESNVWNLRLMGAQLSDSGQYECQVNTDPKMNRAVFLIVRVNESEWATGRPYGSYGGGTARATWRSRAQVLGAAEQFVSQGSTVTFTCQVEAPFPPKSVVWMHRGRLVSIQAERGGISMDTFASDSQMTSRLTVAQVGPADAGNYTCDPGSGVLPAVVTLVVTDGERTEAMQRDGLHSGAKAPGLFPASLFLLLLLLTPWRSLFT